MKTVKYIVFLFTIINLFSCKKLVEVDPPPSLSGASVFNDDITATAVLSGMYSRISYAGINTQLTSISKLAGLSADELVLWNTDLLQTAYYTNALAATPTVRYGSELWADIYSLISTCNGAIERIPNSQSLSPIASKQLLGEAKFMRGLFYFYLVNLFGDVPLILTTDYETNRLLAKSSKLQVYQQIIIDLKDAQNQLSTDYLNGYLQKYTSVPERLRPTKWAAAALLARAYLYTNNWAEAEASASIVLNQTALFSLVTLNSVFLKNSKEAIWQLQPTTINENTKIAGSFLIPKTGFNSTVNVYLSKNLIDKIELNDKRKTSWIDSFVNISGTFFYAYKYKAHIIPATTPITPPTEYLMVLRLAEQFLIRAEARAHQDNITGAKSDLNAIRGRAGLDNTTATTSAELLVAIAKERQIELFTEWGDRWFNLKRTKAIDTVMTIVTPQKGGVWHSYQQLYPISYDDILKNVNLTQNEGY